MALPLRSISIIVFLFITLTTSISQNIYEIQGQIIDSKTKKPLEYAAIGIQNQHLGTITNQYGIFSFYVPDSLINDSIQINYLGYKSHIKQAKNLLHKKNIIKLKAISNPIEEVIIRPLTPEQIIQKTLANYKDNYPQSPFIAQGFYLQEFIENDVFIDFIEAYVDIYNPPFDDTSKCHARLIQGRTKDSLGQIQFMRKFAEKKQAKAKRKAERKGDTLEAPNQDAINVGFGGPQSVLTEDNIRNLKNYFSIDMLKKFRISFKPDSYYGGRELFVINLESRKPIDHALIDAIAYIDKESYAIVKIKIDAKIKIPTLAKPILRIYRIKTDKIDINQDTEYKLVDNIWYPNKTITSVDADLTKKYSRKYIEHSISSIRKAFVATDIKNNNVKPFPLDEQLSGEPIKDQLGEYDPEFWQNRNKIEYKVKD